ncbi:MAG: class E sortase [Acidimicrobiia bacterium]|nr:class E sortase [Acidimicrobiia bacterium]MDH5421099.1 class E sortase [Acidimicrobiia bacterium]MDH5503019.1 class E sortase [Acidimicrobiia bacterium]
MNHAETKLHRFLRRLPPVILVLGGFALVAQPGAQELAGQWAQLERSQANATPRYALAMGSAYDTVSSDFEASVVSFEIGALPSTTDGRIIGLPGHQPSIRTAQADPEGSFTAPVPVSFGGATIRVPAIDLDQAVVEGVSRENLKMGPGHYPGTALPGYSGNVVISGHRTTYTKPFYDVDMLVAGDSIFLDTPNGTYHYVVRTSYVVDPSNLEPLSDDGTPILTLTTCTPKGSADQRLIVVADLDGIPEDRQS